MEFEKILQDIIEKGADKTADEWLTDIEAEFGAVPLIYKRMGQRPEVLLSHLLYKDAVVGMSTLDPKYVELISLAVSAALNCNHCVQYHLHSALKKGATREEIMEVVLIAGSLAQSTVLADAYRQIDKEAPCDASCDMNGFKRK